MEVPMEEKPMEEWSLNPLAMEFPLEGPEYPMGGPMEFLLGGLMEFPLEGPVVFPLEGSVE